MNTTISMPDKYNSTQMADYGRRLAALLCDQHFASQPDATLDGPAILGFAPVRQINLFVVQQLLRQWQLATSQLRSPYFDFEAPAVQTALTQFQNTLSRHIRLTRATFEPLLSKATAATMRAALNPASAFELLIAAQTPEPSAASAPEMLRYLDLNKSFFTDFLAALSSPHTLSGNELMEHLHRYQDTHFDPQPSLRALVSSLNPLLPLTEADFLKPHSANEPALLPNQITSASESVAVSQLLTDKAPAAEQASSAPLPVSTEFSLHEKLKSNQSVAAPLAATLRAGQFQPAPLSEHGAPKVETLREAISINQRYCFINELFNGENMDYHAAIHHLDTLADYAQARTYVLDVLAPRYDWSRKDEHVTKLLKLTERRFSPS